MVYVNKTVDNFETLPCAPSIKLNDQQQQQMLGAASRFRTFFCPRFCCAVVMSELYARKDQNKTLYSCLRFPSPAFWTTTDFATSFKNG